MATLERFDPIGAFQGARQNALTIQAQEQGIAREAAAAPVRNQLAGLQLGQAQQTAQRGQTEFNQGQAIKKAKALHDTFSALKGVSAEQRPAAAEAAKQYLTSFNIDPSLLSAENLTDESLDEGLVSVQGLIGGQTSVSDLDKAKADKLRAETGKLRAETQTELGGAGRVTDISALTAGVSVDLASKASAAFELSGGGDKGVKAAIKVLDTGTEQEKLKTAPLKLKTSYPNATSEEMTQLENVMRTAKTAESGFKEAAKVREKQRQVKKINVFQSRAVELIDKILANDELDDVIGATEGGDGFFANILLSDQEAEAIADIDEARNILTGGNLDIMTGVLSETDIKIISDLAGGALNRKRGEVEFRKNVAGLRAKLTGDLAIAGEEKTLPKGLTDNGDGTFTTASGQVVRRK